jgi:hypothetical protein
MLVTATTKSMPRIVVPGKEFVVLNNSETKKYIE